jgi:polyisoprenoid-binding protein YceI/NAD(P)H-dependent FMN reductase
MADRSRPASSRPSGTILAISGSLRRASINSAALRASVRAAARDGIRITLADCVRDLPPFDPDRDKDPPASVLRFRNACEEAIGVLLAVPEYTFGSPGWFKNALDWAVGSGSLYRKPITVLKVSPPGCGAYLSETLNLALRAHGADVVHRSVPVSQRDLARTARSATRGSSPNCALSGQSSRGWRPPHQLPSRPGTQLGLSRRWDACGLLEERRGRGVSPTSRRPIMATAAPPFAGKYELDPNHSTFQFAVRHVTVSTFRATFADIDARLSVDGDTIELDGRAVADSVSIVDPAFREHVVRGADFFNADAYPLIVFRSTSVDLSDNGAATVSGDLTIRGVSNSVTARGTYRPPTEDPFGRYRAGLELRATVDRRKWKMNWQMPLPDGSDALGWEVEITAHLELVRKD